MLNCIIIGASHAGVSAAFSLRKAGFQGKIIIIERGRYLPYHRPPLSKAFLLANDTINDYLIKSELAYEEEEIELRLGLEVTNIDRQKKQVLISDGNTESYHYLILATGGSPMVPPISGLGNNPSVFYLRDAKDALALRSAAKKAEYQKVVIIGGGYIGLEIASSLKKSGLEVTLLEREERLLARVASPETSDYFLSLHQEHGVTVELGKTVTSISPTGDQFVVECSDGSNYETEIIVVGVGIKVNDTLARKAGLKVANGIIVNSKLQTSDPSIYSIGDAACFPSERYGRWLRLESVQNAVDQAKILASNICGGDSNYDGLPWFWSDQFDIKLQIVGLSQVYDEIVERKEVEEGRNSIWYFKDGELIAVDAMNNAKAYMLGMKAIKTGRKIIRKVLLNNAIPLHPKSLFQLES